MNGMGLGEAHDGGFAGRLRLPADWLVPLPPGLSLRQAMALGTAGFTAALALHRMERNGQAPGDGTDRRDRRDGRRRLGGGLDPLRPRLLRHRGVRAAGAPRLPARARRGRGRHARRARPRLAAARAGALRRRRRQRRRRAAGRDHPARRPLGPGRLHRHGGVGRAADDRVPVDPAGRQPAGCQLGELPDAAADRGVEPARGRPQAGGARHHRVGRGPARRHPRGGPAAHGSAGRSGGSWSTAAPDVV